MSIAKILKDGVIQLQREADVTSGWTLIMDVEPLALELMFFEMERRT
jgi:hypothetical protein